jgi:hypothetical protein
VKGEVCSISTPTLTEEMAMRYMMFIRGKDDVDFSTVPPGMFTAMDELIQRNQKSGALVETAGLQPTKAGFRIRQSKRKLTTTDGPFTESKEVVGGFAIMECKTRDEAMAHAREFMELHLTHWPDFEGECEVRPYMDADPQAS